MLGELALDDAYCAGRIAETLGGEPADSAAAAIRLAHSFGSALEGLGASQSARNLRHHGLDADIEWCARESVLAVAPRFVRMAGAAAEVALEGDGGGAVSGDRDRPADSGFAAWRASRMLSAA